MTFNIIFNFIEAWANFSLTVKAIESIRTRMKFVTAFPPHAVYPLLPCIIYYWDGKRFWKTLLRRKKWIFIVYNSILTAFLRKTICGYRNLPHNFINTRNNKLHYSFVNKIKYFLLLTKRIYLFFKLLSIKGTIWHDVLLSTWIWVNRKFKQYIEF